MHRVVHHRRRQRVVTHQVRYLVVIRHDEAIDDARLRQEPVAEMLLGEDRRQIKLRQVLKRSNVTNEPAIPLRTYVFN